MCDTAEEARRRELSLRNTSARVWTNTQMMQSVFCASLRKRKLRCGYTTCRSIKDYREKGNLLLDSWVYFCAHSKTLGTFNSIASITQPSVLAGDALSNQNIVTGSPESQVPLWPLLVWLWCDIQGGRTCFDLNCEVCRVIILSYDSKWTVVETQNCILVTRCSNIIKRTTLGERLKAKLLLQKDFSFHIHNKESEGKPLQDEVILVYPFNVD